ncbi:Cyclic di-GMP phosphodiesterase Gmr [compost metagenome]
MIRLRTFLILTFTAFVFFLSIVLSIVFGHHSTKEIQNEIGQSLSGIAFQMSNKLDHFMWSKAGEVDLLAGLAAFQEPGQEHEIKELLERLKTNFPSFSWIGYLDTEGNVLAATDDILVGTNIASRPVFTEGIKGKFIGDVHEAVLLAKLLPNPGGEPLKFVDISLPVKNKNGTTIGVLTTHLSWEWSKRIQSTIFQPDMIDSKELEIFIISKKDDTVLMGPQDMIGKPLQLESVKKAQNGENGWELVNWPDGKSYLTGYAYGDGYLDYEGMGWAVLVRQPEDLAFSSVNNLRNFFFITGGIAAALFAFLGSLLAERISRPIRGLTQAANRLRAGENIVIPEYKTFTELFILSRSLRSLVESLNRTESALGDMKTLAHKDQLTGLPNRVALEGYLEQTLHELNLDKEILVFMYLDLDGFKTVNDTLGHQVGDILLQKVAHRLVSMSLPGNIVVRLGGDEFLYIIRMEKSETLMADLEQLGNGIITKLNKPFVIKLNQIDIGCSIGVSLYPMNGTNPSDIIQMADECLYHSKQTGKNRISFATKKME